MTDSPDRAEDPDETSDADGAADEPLGGIAPERLLFLFALALVTAGLGAALYLWSDRDDDPEPAARDEASGLEGDDSAADASVGPEPGAAVEAYLADRTAALSDADGQRVAIVSFSGYVAPDEADQRLSDTEVGVLLIAFPGDTPTASDDVAQLRSELTAEAEAQLPELRSILPTVDDPEFADFYAAEIERYEQILAAGATEEVVFGAIVRADADVLRDLAEADGVRLVDVAESDAVTHGASLRGLRPEETAVAGDPPTRPAG